jgi:hypothetical protein
MYFDQDIRDLTLNVLGEKMRGGGMAVVPKAISRKFPIFHKQFTKINNLRLALADI